MNEQKLLVRSDQTALVHSRRGTKRGRLQPAGISTAQTSAYRHTQRQVSANNALPRRKHHAGIFNVPALSSYSWKRHHFQVPDYPEEPVYALISPAYRYNRSPDPAGCNSSPLHVHLQLHQSKILGNTKYQHYQHPGTSVCHQTDLRKELALGGEQWKVGAMDGSLTAPLSNPWCNSMEYPNLPKQMRIQGMCPTPSHGRFYTFS